MKYYNLRSLRTPVQKVLKHAKYNFTVGTCRQQACRNPRQCRNANIFFHDLAVNLCL